MPKCKYCNNKATEKYYGLDLCRECYEIRTDPDRIKKIVAGYARYKVEELARKFRASHQSISNTIRRYEKKGEIDYSKIKKSRKINAIREADKYNSFKNGARSREVYVN